MRKHFATALAAIAIVLGAAQVFAQSATVVMRNGDRVTADVIDMGANFTFRINGQERQVPINDVALIDFAGNGRGISQDEVNRANDAGGNGFVVLRSGETFTGRLEDITGSPAKGVFPGGRQIALSDVSRIYLGSVSNIADISNSNQTLTNTVGTSGTSPSMAPGNARTITVPANVAWTDTGLRVSRGQALRFEPSGEIRLSTNGDDVATAAGARSFRFAAAAPIPTIPAGALIGRVNNGQPFSIGDTTQPFRMPASGTLFLGINDDVVNDNSGNIVVRIWQP
jgi:hypothetical protein